MSKYRVIVKPSSIEKRFVLLVILLSLVPVWMIESRALTGVWSFQCLLSLGLVLLALQYWNKKGQTGIVLVEESGTWISLNEDEPMSWKISDGSRVTKFMLWVELLPSVPSVSRKAIWLWVFPDSVSKRDFRRLSRIIIRLQRANKDGSLNVR